MMQFLENKSFIVTFGLATGVVTGASIVIMTVVGVNYLLSTMASPFPELHIKLSKGQDVREGLELAINQIEDCLRDRFKRSPLVDYQNLILNSAVTIPGEKGAGYERVLATELEFLFPTPPQTSSETVKVVVRTSQSSFKVLPETRLRVIDEDSSKDLDGLREEVRACLSPWTKREV